MDTFPFLKSIFMFPRTRLTLSLLSRHLTLLELLLCGGISHGRLSLLSEGDRAVREVLEMHGMKGGTNDDFLMLKSEYIGRKSYDTGSLVIWLV